MESRPNNQELPHDVVVPEAYPEQPVSDKQQEKLEQLARIREAVDATTDRLGHPIEPGIKETVILLSALEFQTTQSCEGHSDWGVGIPWVEMASVAEQDNHERDRLKQEAETLYNLSRAHDLLKEFYAAKGVDNYNQILRLSSRGWGFVVDSNITNLDEHLVTIDREKREEIKTLCEREKLELEAFIQRPENKDSTVQLEYYHDLPKGDDWFEDKERYQEIQRSFLEVQAKAHALLRQFYALKGFDPNAYDRLLMIDRGGRQFRIQSSVDDVLNLLTVEQRARVLPDYQREMQEFTEFLKQQYMS